MAGSSNTVSRTSSPNTDSFFHSDPPYSAPNAASSPAPPAGRLDHGAFLSGRIPLNVNGTSGKGSGCNAAAAAAANPSHTECKTVEVHGVKVASFTVNGVELICLPQVFEVFLKHLVGGLHTVYTKLKRLDISPTVCTVEQVRVLRGLGAIQPGVNRCKLITTAHFEALYRDCTNASSRPGRPPKRTLGVTTVTDGSRLLPQGLINPALLTHTGLMSEALKLQKMRMMMGFHGNSDQQRHHHEAESETEDTGGSDASWEKPAPLHLNTLQQHSALLANRLSDIPFMVMPHIPFLPPASVAMAMSQMSHMTSLANNMAAAAAAREPDSQSASRDSDASYSPQGHTLADGEMTETETHIKEKTDNADDEPLPLLKPTNENPPLNSSPAFSPLLLAEGLSSMETLLTNIQGLLRVAVQSARSQDSLNQTERKELKHDLQRERETRVALQRRLSDELHTRVWIQRRLKKEKKAKRKLLEELSYEARRRQQAERAKLQDANTDCVIPDSENNQQENSAAQENRLFIKPPLLF